MIGALSVRGARDLGSSTSVCVSFVLKSFEVRFVARVVCVYFFSLFS